VPLTQILNPHVLNEFLEVQKSILRRKFPEAKRKSKRGRPRIGYFWVLAGICIVAKLENIAWRDLPSKLSNCTFLVDEGLLQRIPSYSTFNRIWNRISVQNLETWISHLGYQQSKLDAGDLAIDSSGFETRSGSIWRFIKWDRRKLSKTSKLFRKIHLAVSLPSRAVVSAVATKSQEQDAHGFGRLWLKLSKKLIPKIRRVHAYKVYWVRRFSDSCTRRRSSRSSPARATLSIMGQKVPWIGS